MSVDIVSKTIAAAAAFQASASPAIIMTEDNIVVVMNAAAEGFTGYSAADIEGHSIALIIHPSQAHPHDKPMHPYLPGGDKEMADHDDVMLANGKRVKVDRRVIDVAGKTYLVGFMCDPDNEPIIS